MNIFEKKPFLQIYDSIIFKDKIKNKYVYLPIMN